MHPTGHSEHAKRAHFMSVTLIENMVNTLVNQPGQSRQPALGGHIVEF